MRRAWGEKISWTAALFAVGAKLVSGADLRMSRSGLSIDEIKRRTAQRLATDLNEKVKPGAVALSIEELKLQTRLREDAGLSAPAPAAPPPPPPESASSAFSHAAAEYSELDVTSLRRVNAAHHPRPPPPQPIVNTPPGTLPVARSRLHHHPYLALTHYHFHTVPHHHGSTDTVSIADLSLSELYEAITLTP